MIENYSDLTAQIASWLHRDDLSNEIDDFIRLTETWLQREPTLPESRDIGGIRADIQRTSSTMTINDDTLTLPSDYADHYRLRITGPHKNVIRYLSPSKLAIYKRTGKGLPAFYTVSDKIELDVAPDSDYPYEFSYWPNLTGLSASNPTNWVITNYPDVYLSACLYWASRYTQDQAEAENWLSQYKSSAWTASETYRQSTISQGSIAITTDSSTP